ncbi:MAG: dNTP triphosphohydrolase [Planctomycetes bacterium]|jgi:dGTPase|nr:dNTP triphosphohydrolase [Planctomycetota bacterium]
MHTPSNQQSTLPWQEREQHLLASYAMHSIDSEGREHNEPHHRYRGPFQRDRDRILHSAAFRRLSGKMQVFTGDMGDYHRTRLTHTHEVASLARTIGRTLGLNEDLIEALALLHDIGHPPYGHCGEDALDESLRHEGGFSHNQFALDLVTHLEQRYTQYSGLNLTREVLSGQQFRSHKDQAATPVLEIQVVDAADSIAYDAHDVDDALKLGLLDWQQLSGLALVERARHLVPLDQAEPERRRQLLVHTLIELQISDLLEQSKRILEPLEGQTSLDVQQEGCRLEMTDTFAADKGQLERFLFENVYRHPRLIQIRQQAAERLRELFDLLLHHPARLPDRFQTLASSWGVSRATGIYLAGMTDRFCEEQYEALIVQEIEQGADWS